MIGSRVSSVVSTQVNTTCCDVSPTHCEAYYPALAEDCCRPRSPSHGETWRERARLQLSLVGGAVSVIGTAFLTADPSFRH
ncbi:hypothetical protein UPYG_G00308620 [Umbra pygmaea]|uniref:Uncharacterized protein n=1 Tax=Umbra pygmaea TaxID=75934 RepID=A0ABD0WLZ6_UMBPY